MEITSATVKALREKTGAGMMDCKKALVECQGDLEKASEWLRAKGMAAADKKKDRVTSEGAVLSYIHGEGKIGVLLEVNCETDFVARTAPFKQFVQDLALQVAAMNPTWIRSEEVPAQLQLSSEELKEKCLLSQSFIKDDSKTVEQVWREAVAQLGENVHIRRFTRYVLGEPDPSSASEGAERSI